MRALLIAFVSAIVYSTSANAASGPPVIHEPFTPPPCPAHPVSTLDLEGCAGRAVLKSDRSINVRARKVFRLLRPSAARTTFVQSERSWLAYRRASCSAQASVYTGGSAEPVAFLQCEVNRNKRHLTDLAEMERWLRQH